MFIRTKMIAQAENSGQRESSQPVTVLRVASHPDSLLVTELFSLIAGLNFL